MLVINCDVRGVHVILLPSDCSMHLSDCTVKDGSVCLRAYTLAY